MLRDLQFKSFGKIDAGIQDRFPLGTAAFIDCDTPVGIPVPNLNAICRIVGIKPKTICFKRTRRGWHIIIVLSETLSPIELIAFQAIAGSDRMREALNFMRCRCSGVADFWQKRSNILYEYKVTK